MAAEAEVTGKSLAPCSGCEPEQKAYVIIRVMKKQQARAARAIICLVLLVVMQGCTTFQNRASGKSWSQIAAEEEREQELNQSLPGD